VGGQAPAEEDAVSEALEWELLERQVREEERRAEAEEVGAGGGRRGGGGSYRCCYPHLPSYHPQTRRR